MSRSRSGYHSEVDREGNVSRPYDDRAETAPWQIFTGGGKDFPGVHATGVAIKNLKLPPNCIISRIIHHREIVIPRGITTLEEGDEILALVDDAARG